MATERCNCDHCGSVFDRKVGQANRCDRTYCGMPCAGLARRCSTQDKKARKSEYDRKRRAELGDKLLEQKRAHHKRTYTPEKGREFRAKQKAGGWSHAAYCREYYSDPEKKAAKIAYDIKRRSKERYGAMWEAAIALQELKNEIIKQQPDKYERAKARGYYDRSAQQRRRDAGISRH